MNKKYFSSFQLQCNVVFIGNFNILICQNLSGVNEFKNVVQFSFDNL